MQRTQLIRRKAVTTSMKIQCTPIRVACKRGKVSFLVNLRVVVTMRQVEIFFFYKWKCNCQTFFSQTPLSFTQQLQRHSRQNSRHQIVQSGPVSNSKFCKGSQKHSQILPNVDEYQTNLGKIIVGKIQLMKSDKFVL